MDGDRQDDPAEIPRLIAPLDEGYDLVSGWKQRRQDPLNKTLPSTPLQLDGAQRLRHPAARLQLRAQGVPARGRRTRSTIYGELHRYIPVVAAQAGFRVTEVKVSHRRRTAGRSKYGWQRYLRGYLDLLTVLFLGRYQHRPQHLFGGMGTLLIFIGVLVELYLTVDKLVFGHPIGQRPLLLLGALVIIVGVQLPQPRAHRRAHRQLPRPRRPRSRRRWRGRRVGRRPWRRAARRGAGRTARTPPPGAPPELPCSRE